MDWSRLLCSVGGRVGQVCMVFTVGLDWTGLDWIVLGWIVLGWIVLGWIVLDWGWDFRVCYCQLKVRQ
jgi:hypothetical protein